MLQGVERRMTAAGDAAVLLSTADAAMLRDLLAPELRERVHVIPPCFDVVRPVPDEPQPVRFVFIGSDRQSQNRLTIEYLVSVWAECRPAAPLVIGGPMVRQWPETPNVTFTGWLERTSDLYTPGSVMITPSFIRGGIKTKVLDAFAHGCAAIGNEATFEGLPQLDAYPFRFDDAGLRGFLADLPRQAGPLHEAARMGQKALREHFSREGFVRAWEGVLSGRTERAGSAVA
jgi:glycosyltransferase involved in cell wall biosynthesis